MSSEEGVHDVIIIGGGPAGLTAAVYASRSGLDTLVLARQMAGGQAAMTDFIENYPGFPEGISGFDLVDGIKRQAIRFGAQLQEIEAVEGFETGEVKEIKTGDGAYRARSVIVATGVDPKGLGLSLIHISEPTRLRRISYAVFCLKKKKKKKTK